MHLKTILLAISLFLSTVANADIELHQIKPEGRDALFLTGEIKRADVTVLERLAPQHRVIFLNSAGGNLDAAMDLGRILRKLGTVAIVSPDHVCASACVFVLAGSNNRTVGGKVGIHRPYQSRDDATTAEEQKTFYSSLGNKVKEYLNEMNINPALYDDMIRISSDSVKFLSEQDLERYGLSEMDPYTEEADSAYQAKELKISKQELLKRKAKIDRDCQRYMNKTQSENYGICAVAILYGISMDEYRRRDELAKRECGNRDEAPMKYHDCYEKITRGF